MSCVQEKNWYIIQVLSGFENKVVHSLNEHIKLYNVQEKFGKIIIPTEEVVEIKQGFRKKSLRKFFPGYILIQMIMDDFSWYFVRGLPRVVGFVGGSPEKPTPVGKDEIDSIIRRLKKTKGKVKPKVSFGLGEKIRVKEGPFSDFNGIVEEVDYEKSRLKVSVSIFGRSTPVELNFHQVEKE